MIGGMSGTGVLRGLVCRCPNCGEARLFSRYLTVRSPCPVCKIDNTKFASDDLPPYLTIVVVGHIVVPAFLWFDGRYAPELSVEALIWLPLSIALSLALLPSMKGASIGLAWASGTVRQSDDQAVVRQQPVLVQPVDVPVAAKARAPRP